MTDTAAPAAVATGAPVPDRPTPARLIDAIAERLAHWPRGALVSCDEGGSFSAAPYDLLWRRSLAMAEGLAAEGIGAGAIVAIAARDALDFAPAFWAALRRGCTVLPLSARAGQGRGEALAQVLAALSEAIVLAEAGSRAQEVARRLGLTFLDLEPLGASGSPAKPATSLEGARCLMPTSGSTGRMKLAELSEAALLRRLFERQGPAAADDTRLLAFDLDSITGITALLPGSPRQVLVPPGVAAGRPWLLAEAAQDQRVTRMALTCSLAGLLATELERSERAWDLGALRQVNLGGESVDPHVAWRLGDALARSGARDLRMVVAYGAAESGNLAAGAPIPRPRSDGASTPPLSVGPPARGVELRIVGEDGGVLGEGEIGAIEARAPGFTFSGYWGDASATAAAFSPDVWFRTGDLGSLEGGQLTLHGRVKEMIIARGAKHALADIDSVLQSALRRALPHRRGLRVLTCALRGPGEATEQLAAVVFSAEVPGQDGIAASEPMLRQAAAERFGLGLKRIAFAPANRLPLGPGGKVIRRELAALLAQASAVPAEASDQGTGDDGWLEALWRQVLACSGPVGPDSHFLELGGDSLASAQLFAALETRLERRLAPDRFFAKPTFANLKGLVRDLEAQAPSGLAALPATPFDKLRLRMEAWPGERPSRDRLLAGLNPCGGQAPLVWVFQGGEEFAALGRALGPDQPLYGFRSGHLVFRYTEAQVDQVAGRYVDDILEVRPHGPLVLGGNCQGGILALAMARRLSGLGRQPKLLVLMEWSFRLKPYGGPVLFLHGPDTPAPSQPIEASEPLAGVVETRAIPGAHGGFFWSGNVEALAATLSDGMARTGA